MTSLSRVVAATLAAVLATSVAVALGQSHQVQPPAPATAALRAEVEHRPPLLSRLGGILPAPAAPERPASEAPASPPPASPPTAAAASPAAARPARPAPSALLHGLSGWVDLYDYSDALGAGPAAALVDEAAAQGVQVLWVQTSRYNTGLLASPHALAALVDRARARGMKVVAWTLPEFRSVRSDMIRAQAAGGFRTARGGRFDAVALDVEIDSVSLTARNAHLLTLAQRLHGHLGVPLYAIVPPPLDLLRRGGYWPIFPWRTLAGRVDGMATMGYWSDAQLPAASFTAQVVADVHRLVGSATYPVHTIGGLASLTSPADVAAFCATAHKAGAVGAGLYDVHSTPASSWSALAGCRF